MTVSARFMLRSLRAVLPAFLAMGATAPGCNGPSEPPPAQAQPAKATLPAPTEMIKEAPGVDLSRLGDVQRSGYFQLLNTEASACGKAHSLATSLRDDKECRDSQVVAQFMADQFALGVTPSELRQQIQYVTAALKPREIPVEGRPIWGNEKAPVTVVVFADFECPHCRAEAPRLRTAVERFRGQARLIYKHFPLGGHARAREAAVACEAAHAQGKFWQMHDKVFANQLALEDDDLKAYAKEIGLDMAAFEAHVSARKGEPTVDADRADGEKLELTGTPAVFVNGRQFNPLLFGGTVEGWIDDALKR